MKQLVLTIILLISINLFAKNNLYVDTVYNINSEIKENVSFNKYITVYKSKKNYNLTDVLSKTKSGELKKTTNKGSRGFNTYYYWIFFKINNTSKTKIDLILKNGSPNIDKAILFSVKNEFIDTLHKTGTSIKFSERTIQSNLIYFPIALPPNLESNLYVLKIEKLNKSLSFPLYIENPISFEKAKNFNRTFHFIYFSILIVIIFISLIFGIITKQKELISYGLYILSLGVFFFQYKAYAIEFLYPNYPIINTYLDGIKVVILITFTYFTIIFLNLKKHLKKAVIVFKVIILLSVLLLILITFNIEGTKVYSFKAFYYLGILLLLSFPYLLFKVYSKNKLAVSIFTIALGFIILGTLTTMLVGLGYLPGVLLNYDLMILGSFIEVLIFAFAIIYKFTKLEKTRHNLLLSEAKTQQELLKAYLTGSKKSNASIVSELNSDVKLKLDNIKTMVGNNDESNTEKINKSISEVYEDIRRISHKLSHQTLKFTGLKQSIIDLVFEFNKSSKANISINVIDFDDLFNKDGILIYRVINEALANAVIHSKCKNINIEIIGHEDETIYTIDDDGIGFITTKLTNKNNLLNMQSRIELLGGFFEISSNLGTGTNIFFSIPLKTINREK